MSDNVATVRITGDEVMANDVNDYDEVKVQAIGPDRVALAFEANENGYDNTECVHCHREISEVTDRHGVTTLDDEFGASRCEDNPETPECPACEGRGELTNPEGDLVTTCPTCEGDGEVNGPHVKPTGPSTWLNSAQIHLSDQEDSVTVSISVGDPRGGFSFTVRRIPADSGAEHAGQLIMHLPYPNEPLPHMTLTPLHTGTYLIS